MRNETITEEPAKIQREREREREREGKKRFPKTTKQREENKLHGTPIEVNKWN